MALLPKPPQMPLNPSDKIQHMIAFAVLASLASHAYFRTSLVKIGVGLAGFGALIEVLQSIPLLHRDSSVVDWLADCGAIAVVLGVMRLRN
jgi:VanZ family protein